MMYLNKGVYNGIRILSRAMFNYSKLTAVPAGAFFTQYGGFSDIGNNNKKWSIMQSFMYANSPISEIYLPSSYEINASSSYPVPGCNLENSLTWSGNFGNIYYIDLDTGLYILQVNQVTTACNRAKTLSDVGMVPLCL